MIAPTSSLFERQAFPAKQRGMALLVSVVMVTIVLIIMATMTYRHQLDAARNSKALISEQAILLALSAESWAKSLLRQDAEDNSSDSLQDDWAQAIPVLPVEGGMMTGCIIDMQSMYNINNLGQLNQATFAEALQNVSDDILEFYINILEGAGLDAGAVGERAAPIVDWIDSDTELVAAGSAEDAEYSFEDPPRLAANAPLTSLSELVSVYGYSLADIRALDNLVTALPIPTAINVNTAPEPVLVGLSTLIDDFMVENIVEARPYDDKNEFYDALEEEIGYMTSAEIKEQLPEQLFDVASSFFELRAQVTLAGENIALISTFERRGREEPKTLSRTLQYIPDLVFEEDDINPLQGLCERGQESDEDDEDTDGVFNS